MSSAIPIGSSPLTDSSPFAYLGPAQQPHNTWEAISVHTAKCDVCHKHNRSIIQRCTKCNLQLCKDCIHSSTQDGIHFANEGDLNWSPEPRAAKGIKKDDSGPSTTTGHETAFKVTKPATSRRTKSTNTERLMSDAMEFLGGSLDESPSVRRARKRTVVKEKPRQQFKPVLPRFQPSVPTTLSPDEGPRSGVDEDSMVEQSIAKAGSSRQKRRASSKKSVRWADIDNGSDEDDTSEDMSIDDRGKQQGREPVAQAMVRLSRQRKVEKLDQETAEAWAQDLIILSLLAEGKDGEAMDLLEAAHTLMASQRGLIS